MDESHPFLTYTDFSHHFSSTIQPSSSQDLRSDLYRSLDVALDALGTKRFQYLVLLCTTFGHFVEAAESTLLGVLLPVLMKEFLVETEQDIAIVGALTAIGCMIGAGCFAQLSNVWGRRVAYQVSLGICVGFGFVSSFATSVGMFAGLRLGFGIGYGGNIVASTTLLVELTPTKSRSAFMTVNGLAYGMGAIFSTCVAWAVVPTLGWRWLIRIVSVVSIPTLLLLPCLPESPRFYVMRGRPRDALDSLAYMARINRVELPREVQRDLESAVATLQRNRLGVSTLASDALLSVNTFPWASLVRSAPTIAPLALIWFSHSFAATIFWFVPLEIQNRTPEDPNIKFEISLVMACGGLLGCLFLLVTSQYFGRITQLRWSLLVTAVLTMILGLDAASPSYVFVVAFILETMSQYPISVLYILTPESHPTDIRTLAFGMCQFCHRLAPIIAPFAVAALDNTSFETSCLVFGSIFLFSFFLTFALTRETFGRGLVEDDDYATITSSTLANPAAVVPSSSSSPKSMFEQLLRSSNLKKV